MSKPQTFHVGAAAIFVLAIAAALIAVLDAEIAIALVATALAAIVALIVLADRRTQKATGQLRRRIRAWQSELERPLSEISTVRSDVTRALRDAAGLQGRLADEVAALRSELESPLAELGALKGEITRIQNDAARLQSEITASSDRIMADARAHYDGVQKMAASAWTHREGQARTLRWQLGELRADLVNDAQALQQLLARYSPDGTLPPLNRWALGPTGLAAVLDLVERRNVRTVVECGSGTSTLWLAYALRAVGGGRVIALEHQADFVEKTRAMINAHGLGDWVDVRHAPLVPTQTQRGSFLWYDLDPASVDAPIDLLLVDGPPGDTGVNARYPAFPVLRQKLATGAFVVADDVDRDDEGHVLALWQEDDPSLAIIDRVGSSMEILVYGGTGASPRAQARPMSPEGVTPSQ